MRKLLAQRRLKREMRREALLFIAEGREYGEQVTADSLRGHLMEEFSAFEDGEHFDVTTIMALISLILKLMEVFLDD